MLSRTRFFSSGIISFSLFVFLTLLLESFPTRWVFASDFGANLASSFLVEDEVQNGDIISYDSQSQSYYATNKQSDKNIFGIIVSDPILLMGDKTASNMEAVVRIGETTVNVSDYSGEIKAGDLITSSHIVGVGQQMPVTKSGYIVGVALTDAEYGTELYQTEEKNVRLGKVLVSLKIGYVEGISEEEVEDEFGVEDEGAADQTEEEGITPIMFFRYTIGAFVIVISIVLVLRRFGNLFEQSVISVGRNPLAHSKIRSILIWNAILIVIIGSIGIGAGVALIVI